MDLLLVVAAALVGSLFSLIGGLYLIYGSAKTEFIKIYAVPFAAGALLAASFFDLLPEALEGNANVRQTLAWALAGILLFFILERGLRWFHQHQQHDSSSDVNKSLIVVGDLVHNLIDGLALGAAFLVNPATGIIATFAIAAHEIPQEIGDFALLLSKGMKRKSVLLINLLSALVTVVAAAAIFIVGSELDIAMEGVLALTAGFFVYIAVSDIIPSIHAAKSPRLANIQTFVLLLSVVLVALTTTTLHRYIDDGHAHTESAEHDEHEEHGDQEEHGHEH